MVRLILRSDNAKTTEVFRWRNARIGACFIVHPPVVVRLAVTMVPIFPEGSVRVRWVEGDGWSATPIKGKVPRFSYGF